MTQMTQYRTMHLPGCSDDLLTDGIVLRSFQIRLPGFNSGE
jgi:hypothetical protein